jgi:hypothetical protein
MKKLWYVLVFVFVCSFSFGQDIPSSRMTGLYAANERAILVPAFVNGVNDWLRRYEPVLVERRDDYVKMTTKYEYLFNLELFVKNGEYEIVVTIGQERYNQRKAQEISLKLAQGVYRAMLKYVARAKNAD